MRSQRNLLIALVRASFREVASSQNAAPCAVRGLATLSKAFSQNAITQSVSLGNILSRRPSLGFAPLALQQNYQPSRSMFIQTQPTPNPTSLMFLPGKPVIEGSPHNFSSAREAMASPLAKRLFLIDGVTQVFFGPDFVTVTKSDDYAWSVIKPDVFAAITEFYASGEPVLLDANNVDPASAAHVINDDDDEVVAMIKELLETRIRPAVQEDGGDIAFRTFDLDSGVVTLKMMGACSGCPSSAITLKSGIENMLMHYIPEVKAVEEAPEDEAELEGKKAFHKLEQHLSN